MSDLTIIDSVLPATPLHVINSVLEVEQKIGELPQIDIRTEHVFHAGLYARTVRLDKGMVIVSALVKIPTTVIVNGTCNVFAGDEWRSLDGYNVIPAAAGRKLIYVALSDVQITMLFKSNATTVEEAESEFTNDGDKLLSRTQHNEVVITGVE